MPCGGLTIDRTLLVGISDQYQNSGAADLVLNR
jgi:hypothetical protein